MGYREQCRSILQASHTVFDPADSSTYYFGQLGGSAPSGADIYHFTIPFKGVVRSVTIKAQVGTPGSAEDSTIYIRKNGTTDYTVTAAMKYDSATENLSVNSLNIPFEQGDYFSFKMTTPAWVTNPLQVRQVVGILFTFD